MSFFDLVCSSLRRCELNLSLLCDQPSSLLQGVFLFSLALHRHKLRRQLVIVDPEFRPRVEISELVLEDQVFTNDSIMIVRDVVYLCLEPVDFCSKAGVFPVQIVASAHCGTESDSIFLQQLFYAGADVNWVIIHRSYGMSRKVVGKPTQVTIKGDGRNCLPEIKVSDAEGKDLQKWLFVSQARS